MADHVVAVERRESHVSEHLEAVVSGRLHQALVLTLIILVVELAGGVWSHSLALLSDAGHVTTDIFALGWRGSQSSRPSGQLMMHAATATTAPPLLFPEGPGVSTDLRNRSN